MAGYTWPLPEGVVLAVGDTIIVYDYLNTEGLIGQEISWHPLDYKIRKLAIMCYGAGGAGSHWGTGGNGGYVHGTLLSSKIDFRGLKMSLGQGGKYSNGQAANAAHDVYGGGASGYGYGGGGGGATYVMYGYTEVLVAGGGGGASERTLGGNVGGGLVGGRCTETYGGVNYNAYGGTQTEGGNGNGNTAYGSGNLGQKGGPFFGNRAGNITNSGGGGGGGHYGGGGGSGDYSAGGGGSSYYNELLLEEYGTVAGSGELGGGNDQNGTNGVIVITVLEVNKAPNKPPLTAYNGTSEAPTACLSDRPVLSWDFSDPEPGDTQSAYQLKVYDMSTVTPTLVIDVPKTLSALGSYTPSAGILQSGVKYYWEVTTWDNLDTQGAWSSKGYFRVNGIPDKPILRTLNAPNTAEAGFSGSLTPSLQWSFLDPDAGDIQSAYQIYVYEEPSGTLIYNSGKVVSTAVSKVLPSGKLVLGKTYYWVLKTWDNYDTVSSLSSKGYFIAFAPKIDLVLPNLGNARAKENIDYLRTKVNEFRQSNGLTVKTWSDPTIVRGLTPVRAIHWNELTDAAEEVYTQAGLTPKVTDVQSQFDKPALVAFDEYVDLSLELPIRVKNILQAIRNASDPTIIKYV